MHWKVGHISRDGGSRDIILQDSYVSKQWPLASALSANSITFIRALVLEKGTDKVKRTNSPGTFSTPYL